MGLVRLWRITPRHANVDVAKPGVADRNDVSPADDGGFRDLFNGRDLAGWKTFPGEPKNWKVEQGRLIGTGPWSFLYTDRGDYTDFHLRVEAKINRDGNSGVFFRYPFMRECVPGYRSRNRQHGRSEDGEPAPPGCRERRARSARDVVYL